MDYTEWNRALHSSSHGGMLRRSRGATLPVLYLQLLYLNSSYRSDKRKNLRVVQHCCITDVCLGKLSMPSFIANATLPVLACLPGWSSTWSTCDGCRGVEGHTAPGQLPTPPLKQLRRARVHRELNTFACYGEESSTPSPPRLKRISEPAFFPRVQDESKLANTSFVGATLFRCEKKLEQTKPKNRRTTHHM